MAELNPVEAAGMLDVFLLAYNACHESALSFDAKAPRANETAPA